MSNALAVSVTDELVAELEALAGECGQHGANWYEPHHMEAFPEYACDQDFVVAASPATILALLAERAELKRDAERFRWLIRQAWFQSAMDRYDIDDGGLQVRFESEAARIIDAAMQS